MDVLHPPAGEGAAFGGGLVGSVLQQVDRQLGNAALGPAGGVRVRHVHPKLREAPGLVDLQLAAAHVGGVVHLQHHVGKVVAAHQHGPGADQVGFLRVDVQGLVGLHEAHRLPIRALHHEHHGAVALDGRAAHRSDSGDEHSQALPRAFVGRHGAFAHHPSGLEFPVPDLQATLKLVVLLQRHRHGFAASELQVGKVYVLRPRPD